MTTIFDGQIATLEDLVEPGYRVTTTRDVASGRIVRETFTQSRPDWHVVTSSRWSYDGVRLVRIDRENVTDNLPTGYSEFSFLDDGTRIERSCTYGNGYCSIKTLVGGEDTWTKRTIDDDGNGVPEYEETRTLDANGLPIVLEGARLGKDGTRSITYHIEIERRADGAPLASDNGVTQTRYLFECD